MMALSSLYGVKVPKGVQTEDELMRLQNTVGVPATGVWDSSSQAAYEKYLRRFGVPLTTAYQVEGYAAPGMVRNQRDVKIMQEALGNVTVDGIWGPETDGAYKARIGAENGPANASSLPISSGAEIAARIAERLDQISSNTGNKSVPVPVVDSKASLPYTGSGSIPKVQPYQQTITQALIRPAASATAARTTNAGNKPDLGKHIVNNISEAEPIVDQSLSSPYASYLSGYTSDKPYDEFDGAYSEKPSKDEDTTKDGNDPRGTQPSGSNKELTDYITEVLYNSEPLSFGEKYYVERSRCFMVPGAPVLYYVEGTAYVFDENKYCAYIFWGLSASPIPTPYDDLWDLGRVTNIFAPEDYEGTFWSGYMGTVSEGKNTASAKNENGTVKASSAQAIALLGGLSGSWLNYTKVSSGWIYDELPSFLEDSLGMQLYLAYLEFLGYRAYDLHV